MNTRIFIDMDGTLAEWKNVTSNYELYQQGYYESLRPNEHILNETKRLITEGENVFILSSFLSDSAFALEEKNSWLDKYLPELKKENRIFVPYGECKYKYIPNKITSYDYLIDDHTKNLLDWKDAGGTGIKFLNGINHLKGIWQGLLLREDCDISKNLNWILENKYKEENDISYLKDPFDEELEQEI